MSIHFSTHTIPIHNRPLAIIFLFSYEERRAILYPSDEVILKYAEENKDCNFQTFSHVNSEVDNSLEHLTKMKQMAERDDLHEQDRKKLWALRYVSVSFYVIFNLLLICVF